MVMGNASLITVIHIIEVRKNALPYSFLDDFSNLLGMIRDANYIDRQCKIAVNQIRKYENALERRDQ